MTNVAVTTQQAAVTVTTASNVTVVPTTQTAAVVVQGAVQAPTGGGGVILESKQVISEDYTLTAGSNGISQGPVAIEAGYTVTIPAGAIWGIL